MCFILTTWDVNTINVLPITSKSKSFILTTWDVNVIAISSIGLLNRVLY